MTAALFALIAISAGLGWLAQRRAERGNFVKGYFIGNRSLGPWALGLTTMVQSAGTFMGFPALVYSHGWSLALWLSGHMVIPLAAFALMAKRVAQMSRRTGSITVPDLLRERFESGTVGAIASLLILIFMVFSLIGQFKAGALLVAMTWPSASRTRCPSCGSSRTRRRRAACPASWRAATRGACAGRWSSCASTTGSSTSRSS